MTTTQVLVLGIGTTLGIAAQALVLIPALRRTGFHWRWRFRAAPNEVGRMREVGQLAGWVLCYVVASQIGVTVIAAVGGHNKAFTVFTQADLLVQMPYGILVVSLLTALMPRLSRAAARRQHDEVVADLGLGARLSAIALVPITAGLIVLGPVADDRAVRARPDLARRRPPDRHRARRLGVRAVPVRDGHAAAAGVLRDARRPHADADQRVHGGDEDRDRAGVQPPVRRHRADRRRR